MTDSGSLPRWVLLFHKAGSGLGRSDHWDLLIQNGNELDAWALDANPLEQVHCTGIRLAPHRLKYLDQEGELSRDRGTIQKISGGQLLGSSRLPDGCGTFELERETIPVTPVTIWISAADRSGMPVEPGDPVLVEILDPRT